MSESIKTWGAFMFDDYNGNFRDDELSGTLTPNVGNAAPRTGQKVVLPVLTPDRIEKRQNGRRFKDDGEEAFTLTSQDRHGVAVTVDVVGNYSPSGYESARILNPGGIAPTLKENHGTINGVPVEVRNGLQEHQKWQKDGNSPTLTAAMGMGGGYTPVVKVEVKEATRRGHATAGGGTVSTSQCLEAQQEEDASG